MPRWRITSTARMRLSSGPRVTGSRVITSATVQLPHPGRHALGQRRPAVRAAGLHGRLRYATPRRREAGRCGRRGAGGRRAPASRASGAGSARRERSARATARAARLRLGRLGLRLRRLVLVLGHGLRRRRLGCPGPPGSGSPRAPSATARAAARGRGGAASTRGLIRRGFGIMAARPGRLVGVERPRRTCRSSAGPRPRQP